MVGKNMAAFVEAKHIEKITNHAGSLKPILTRVNVSATLQEEVKTASDLTHY